MQLSVLDLSFVTTATPGAAAIRNSLDLAALADRLGYCRYWVAEHHNLPSVASGAPEIMIGQIAATTRHIRVGAGGVMLPNHAPLMVAERFKVLEALHPGRIDLGIGRAPGTDRLTSLALRHRQEVRADDDFLERFEELLGWKLRRFPEGHPFQRIHVMPDDVEVPPIWLLGSSDYSAELAASVGMGFAFAHHFAHHDAADAIGRYLAGLPALGLARAAACDPGNRGGLRARPMPRPSGSPRPSTSTTCAGRRATTGRWSAPRRRRRMLTPPRRKRRGLPTGTACSSAAPRPSKSA